MSSQSHPAGDGEAHPSVETMTAATLRRALVAPADDGANEELRRAVRALADEARRRGLRAEQLVVAIRETWRSLPEARSAASRSGDAGVAARVIGVCIGEYYAGVRDASDEGGGRRETDHGDE